MVSNTQTYNEDKVGLSSDEILKQLKAAGYSSGIIADVVEVHASSVIQVINRSTTSKRIAEVICNAIKKPISEVFADKPQYQTGYSRQTNRANKVAALRLQLAS
jgi:hypothetical protein